MSAALPAKVFRYDDGLAVAIPHGLELPGELVQIRQEGLKLVIEPAPAANPNAALIALLGTLEPIDEDFGPIEDLPPRPVTL